MTVDQFVSDTLAVTNYLRSRFGKEKIYLMGHSWGSFIGIQAAARGRSVLRLHWYGPDVVSTGIREAGLRIHARTVQARGRQVLVHRLRKAPVIAEGGTPEKYLALLDQAMHALGIGTTRDMESVITGIFIPSWLVREHTLREKTDLATVVPMLQIPVYFFHGRHDYTCSYDLAKEYFRKLKVPLKGFYTFENSAHSPVLEEAEKARSILQEDVLVCRA
jgi:pimeloyl-ACP methyl ester carboxylesterase